MMILVYGGSGSGKSAFAEKKITELNKDGRLCYLATMQVYDEEDKERVRRHRKLRSDKKFTTLERHRDIGDVFDFSDDEDNDVLLECMSNLVANEMFDDAYETDGKKKNDCINNSFSDKRNNVVLKIKEDLLRLNKVCNNLVIVSNNVFEDGCDYDKEVADYISALGRINRFAAGLSDEVWEVVAGIPLRIK